MESNNIFLSILVYAIALSVPLILLKVLVKKGEEIKKRQKLQNKS